MRTFSAVKFEPIANWLFTVGCFALEKIFCFFPDLGILFIHNVSRVKRKKFCVKDSRKALVLVFMCFVLNQLQRIYIWLRSQRSKYSFPHCQTNQWSEVSILQNALFMCWCVCCNVRKCSGLFCVCNLETLLLCIHSRNCVLGVGTWYPSRIMKHDDEVTVAGVVVLFCSRGGGRWS